MGVAENQALKKALEGGVLARDRAPVRGQPAVTHTTPKPKVECSQAVQEACRQWDASKEIHFMNCEQKSTIG